MDLLVYQHGEYWIKLRIPRATDEYKLDVFVYPSRFRRCIGFPRRRSATVSYFHENSSIGVCGLVDLHRVFHGWNQDCWWCSSDGGGAENTGVENAGAITYGLESRREKSWTVGRKTREQSGYEA